MNIKLKIHYSDGACIVTADLPADQAFKIFPDDPDKITAIEVSVKTAAGSSYQKTVRRLAQKLVDDTYRLDL